MFLSDEGPTLETLDFTLAAVHQPFYISIWISTLITQNTIDFMFLCDKGPTFEMLDFTYISICVFQHYVYISMFVYLQEYEMPMFFLNQFVLLL